MRIPRTPRGYSEWQNAWEVSQTANEVFVRERPSHSNVLGPDGLPFAYEDPEPIGFVLRKKHGREH